MENINPLNPEELEALRASLPLWTFEPQGAWMRREWVFPDFLKAFEFMTQVATLAHEQDHHPNWSNVYNRVTIQLFTHDCSALTHRDSRLARDIEHLFAQRQ